MCYESYVILTQFAKPGNSRCVQASDHFTSRLLLWRADDSLQSPVGRCLVNISSHPVDIESTSKNQVFAFLAHKSFHHIWVEPKFETNNAPAKHMCRVFVSFSSHLSDIHIVFNNVCKVWNLSRSSLHRVSIYVKSRRPQYFAIPTYGSIETNLKLGPIIQLTLGRQLCYFFSCVFCE